MGYPRKAVVVALLVLGAAITFTHAAANTTVSTLPDPRGIYSVRQDLVRQRTWILTVDAAYLRDSGGAIRRYELAGWIQAYPPQACAPDLVVEAAGSVLISSNVVPRLRRLDPETSRTWDIELDVDGAGGREIGFTRLRWSPDGTLSARSAIDHSTWKIDLLARRATQVRPAGEGAGC